MKKNAFMVCLLIITLLFPATAFCGGDIQKTSGNDSSVKKYDQNAKTMYSENDVISFVYSWFAGFDHQADIKFFTAHLNPEKVDMYFPDFPIASVADFERWYGGVIDNIQWNTHRLTNLNVSGDEKGGFSVSVDVNWKAKTYKGETLEMNVHQDWKVTVDKGRNFIIVKHAARAIDKK